MMVYFMVYGVWMRLPFRNFNHTGYLLILVLRFLEQLYTEQKT